MSTAPSYNDLFVTITGQHGHLRALLEEVAHLKGQQRLDALDLVRAHLAAHEAMEQGWIHPMAAARLADGEGHPGDVDNRLIEERDAGIVLDRLRDLPVDSPLFDVQYALFQESVVHHAKDEEDRELPLLGTHRELEDRITQALRVAAHVGEVGDGILQAASNQPFVRSVSEARHELERLVVASVAQ
ncbi:hemerythrin domain-containing protein [Leekyejoonella antrihumi]|uniref:Hemerythrin domain-containing protein n=1 Tax=Leekyejoonella antrihumi TaxID=1660198 RepID=A0A563E4K4_9MICO|nr:hemerythrin domain-containing protein [Leekyejoonella antrihumi]TWP37229.1 hemerythrin domain-containing protein [Leekyejoonella antrihumi]